ncbi:MAG TPA: MG2 domain-containing protein [Pyrinomonadaceae bacterium]|nr:MG2 domain-containing protein [Pyrinomonadaceae bacterium]
MFRSKLKSLQPSSLLIYLVVISAAFALAHSRVSSAASEPVPYIPAPVTTTAETKPFFSLTSNRTFATGENPKLWVDYRNVDKLDFRVYRVNDPQRFFTQLTNPHQMGEYEQEEISTNIDRKPSLLERLRSIKTWAYSGLRDYLCSQIKSDTRRALNHKFRADETARRTPLNVADYARVPLLNPNQLVTSWREPLTALEHEYDRRMIPLGKREPGVYLVEAVAQDLRAYTVVVVTDLAMVEKSSPNGELVVFAVNRITGEPQADTRVAVVKARNTVASGTTNGEGVFRARILRPENADEVPDDPEVNTAVDNDDFIVLASHRENFAISDLESYYFTMGDDESAENINGYIYTDRPIYRPNHKVFFKGILRAVDEQGQLRAVKAPAVTVTIKDPNDARVTEQELRLTPNGTFSGELLLNEEAPLGTYNIEAVTDEGSSSGTFEVAEYKKPEYKVDVKAAQRFIPAGSKANFDVSARYFFGAPVANAEVKYYIYRSRYYASYFGNEEEEVDDDSDEYAEYGNYYGDMVSQGEGKLDASGHLAVEFDVPQASQDDVWDFEYQIEAQVTDASRRTINASSSVVATRGSVIARARADRYVYRYGDTANLNVTTSDYEGRPVSANLLVKTIRRTWVKVEKKVNEYDSDYKMQEEELASFELKTDKQGRASYAYSITSPGSLVIKTVVQENDKQYVSVGGFIYVTSADNQWADSGYFQSNYGSIKLVPDKKSYRVGETARVLAILPHPGANLFVTTELETVTSARFVKAAGQTVVLDIPIESTYAPNMFVGVTYVNEGDMYTGTQRLVVPARNKMLNLEVIPNKSEYKPRETASYTILARDADGAPVRNAEVSLGVVDEAIYSISPDYTANIRKNFYGMRYNAVTTHLSVSYSFVGYAGDKPINLAVNKPSYQLADFKNQGDQAQPMIRKDFRDTAFWQPNVITGSDGKATVKVRLPDNLTTWRATARGVTSDTMVGSTTSKVIARKDVIMRLEIPRFLTQGDTVTLSGVVHNYLKQPKSTQISISVAGARLIGPAQQTVTIDKQGEHRVDWQISAPQTGQIQLLAKALTNTESDAVELTLDVVPRGVRETKVERWNTTDEAAEQQFTLELPANADLNSRKLRVEVAPSIAGTLIGALDYLTSYPYGCTEQTMSSFLPNIIVSQTLKEFKTASVRGNDLKKKAERGRNRLYSFQHEDGGWGWWKDDKSDPFMTAYVIDGLTLAKHAGYEIDDDRIVRGREKLIAMLAAGTTDSGMKIDPDTQAFMIYALAETGGVENTHVDKLFADRLNLQPYGRALLALTLSMQKDKRAWDVATEIERTARTDNPTAYWHSAREKRLDFAEEDQTEGTAMSLKALSRIKPDSQLLPLVARWLVSDRTNSYYWNSTKDTAFAIYGLIDYLKVSQELAPSYDLEVYVNGETVLAQRVTDAAATQSFIINRKGSAVGPTNHVRIVKRGKGSLYFSSALEYYTGDEQISARGSADLNVTREYYRLSVKEENYQLKWSVSPLTGEINSGDLIVVKLRLTGKPGRHLMLEDPIPAGAEQLVSVGNLNLDYNEHDWSDWYSSREFRDRRTVFFLDSFDGDTTFQYAMRIQVPGDFVVAPARAELMYRPEINANTANAKFSFLDRKAAKQ